MKNMHISAIILTYNEEQNIENCLKSIKGFTEEVFIVDSYSSDRTLEIARKYTDKIYQHSFENQARQFKWALENILKNSLDAMDKREGRIEVRLMQDAKLNRPVIEIEDNGKGIEKSDRKRIFKPGYSTKRRGWGLGLSLAKRIIEEYHKGKLYVKDGKAGEGTVMRIVLRQ